VFRLNTFEFLVLLFYLGNGFDKREIAVQFPEGTKDFSLNEKRLGQMRPTRSPVHWVPGRFLRSLAVWEGGKTSLSTQIRSSE
jgi:hypothetical protein